MSTVQSQHTTATPVQSLTSTPQPGNSEKAPFNPPKLTFITPQLTKQGSLETLTAGFIGTFS